MAARGAGPDALHYYRLSNSSVPLTRHIFVSLRNFLFDLFVICRFNLNVRAIFTVLLVTA